MSIVQIVSLIVGALGAGGGLGWLAFFKYKPGQRQTTEVNVAQGTLNLAQGTIDLITAELEEQFKRMSAEQRDARETHAREIAEERRNVAALRGELAAATNEARDLRKSLRQAWAENETYRRRNADLEAQLKT